MTNLCDFDLSINILLDITNSNNHTFRHIYLTRQFFESNCFFTNVFTLCYQRDRY